MAKIVVRSDRYEDDWALALEEDYISSLMESVVLVPRPDVDAVIAESWCPMQATDMWYVEHSDELLEEDAYENPYWGFYEDDDYYDYCYECAHEGMLSARVVGGVIEYLVKTNDVNGMMNYLRDRGIRVI